MSNDIEELAIKCGALIEEFTGTDNKKHNQICFECENGELEAFVNELTKPQEAVAWLFTQDLERFKTQETTATCYSVKVSNPDDTTVPLFPAPPNYEALLKENERLLEHLQNIKGSFTDLHIEESADSLMVRISNAMQEVNEALKKGELWIIK